MEPKLGKKIIGLRFQRKKCSLISEKKNMTDDILN